MNILGLEDNIIASSRKSGDAENWYLYNKGIRASTSSIIGEDGSLAAAYDYDEFGNTDVRVGEDFYNEICYTGQVYDKVSGLYYYNARYYNAEVGRFITQDTYRGEKNDPGTYHLYVYCANDPINYVDPSGHKAKWISKTATKRYWSPVIEAGHQVWRIRATILVEYKKKSKKKTIKKMSFVAIGDRHTNCGNGSCSFVNVKIYRGNELWKTIKGTSGLVKRGDPVIIQKYSLCYTTKKIDKDYSVGKKQIKIKAYFYFNPPKDSIRTKGTGITTTVNF